MAEGLKRLGARQRLAMRWLDQQIEPDWASVEQALMGFGQAMPKA